MGNKTAKTKKKNPTELTEVKLFMKIYSNSLKTFKYFNSLKRMK